VALGNALSVLLQACNALIRGTRVGEKKRKKIFKK
jgi:hypothetical protein